MLTRTQSLLAALKDVAWADGVLRPEEARFFVEVVSRLDLPDEEAARVFRDVLSCDSGSREELTLDDDDQRWVLAFGYLMAAADGEVDETEIGVLRALADQFSVTWDEAQKIFADAQSLARQ